MNSIVINSGKGSDHRPLYVIGREIRADWTNVWFGAEPYLQVLTKLNTMDDQWMDDTAETIVRYFLGNAKTWRGDKAREIKKELNNMLK